MRPIFQIGAQNICQSGPGSLECVPPITTPPIPRWDEPTLPQWEADQCWIGFTRGTGQQQNLYGCAVGCKPCQDWPVDLWSEQSVVRTDGRRWLFPNLSASNNRNALGQQKTLHSSRPQAVPASGISYLRASCWDNHGLECFGKDSCECFPASHVEEAQEGEELHCSFGELANTPLEGLLPDEFGYSGYDISVSDSVSCRQVGEHGPLPVSLASGGLMQPMFHNTRPGACSPNFLFPCTAKVASVCQGGYGKATTTPDGEPRNQPIYYLGDPGSGFDQQAREGFNKIRVRSNTCSISGLSGEAILKNKVLRYLAERAEVPNFQTLDHQDGFGNPFDVDIWQRAYDGAGRPVGELPVVATLSGRLRQSGCPVIVQLRLVRAIMQLSLIAWRLLTNGKIKVRPYARVRIRAECVPTASLVDPCQSLPGERLLQVFNGGIVPSVGTPNRPYASDVEGGQPLDFITYLDDNGRSVNFPAVVEWWGMLGEFSLPPTKNIWPDPGPAGGYGHDNVNGNSDGGKCKRLAQLLTPTTIRAWPNYSGVYGGALEIGFP